jgi:tyrosine-protein kinase Etk/Wzc
MSNIPVEPANDSDEISLLDIIQVIRENLALLLIGPLVVGLVALGLTFLIPPTYTATTVFLPPQQQQSSASVLLQSLGSLGGIAGAATGLKNPNDQFIAFLKSRRIEDKLVERFKLKDRYDADLLTDARQGLERRTRISSGKDSLITVEVDDRDPPFAAELANAYVEELSILIKLLALTEAQQRRVFFEAQLIATKENLTKTEQALRSTGINSSALKSNPVTAVAAVARMQAEIAAQEIKVSSMRAYLADSAPMFRQALSDLAALRAQLSKLEKSSGTPPASDSDYVARFRDFKYYETLFDLFAKQFELAKVDESREGAKIQVLDVAKSPEKKSKPQRGLIVISAVLTAGGFLLLFIFIRNSLRTSISPKRHEPSRQ